MKSRENEKSSALDKTLKYFAQAKQMLTTKWLQLNQCFSILVPKQFPPGPTKTFRQKKSQRVDQFFTQNFGKISESNF